MSLLSAIILPKLERELVAMEPEIAEFLLRQLKMVASELIEWVEKKVDVDLNADGTIGDDEGEKNG